MTKKRRKNEYKPGQHVPCFYCLGSRLRLIISGAASRLSLGVDASVIILSNCFDLPIIDKVIANMKR